MPKLTSGANPYDPIAPSTFASDGYHSCVDLLIHVAKCAPLFSALLVESLHPTSNTSQHINTKSPKSQHATNVAPSRTAGVKTTGGKTSIGGVGGRGVAGKGLGVGGKFKRHR